MEKDFNRENPQNWKLGFLYFNPQDSRIIVPKRFRMFGWTLNFAHPISWIFILMIMAIAIFVKKFAK